MELDSQNRHRHQHNLRVVEGLTPVPPEQTIWGASYRPDPRPAPKDDHYPSEVSFLPRPGATAEDDGVLISTVLGARLGKSYLLVLNATDLSQIATADAPEFLPFPSHGHSCAPVKGKKICFWG